MGTKAEYPAIIDPKIDPLCSVPCILCYVSCILCSVLCILCSVLCTVCPVPCIVSSVPSVYSAPMRPLFYSSVIIVGKIDLLSGFRPDSCLGNCSLALCCVV